MLFKEQSGKVSEEQVQVKPKIMAPGGAERDAVWYTV